MTAGRCGAHAAAGGDTPCKGTEVDSPITRLSRAMKSETAELGIRLFLTNDPQRQCAVSRLHVSQLEVT